MNNLGNFLEKFRAALGALGAEKEIIIEEIFRTVGVRIQKEAIMVRNGSILITGSASLKSHIFLKKDQILETLKKNPQFKNIKDIR